MTYIYVNGDLVPQNEAKISVHDRSYLFGEGLFESFRSYDGKVPFLKDHLQRMEWAATFLNIHFPVGIDFTKVCHLLSDKNQFKDARFKIMLSRLESEDDDPYAETSSEDTNVVVFVKAYEENDKPYRLKIIKNLRNDAQPLVSMKTTNYLAKVVGRFDARHAGFDDGILLNSQGNVTETTSGNIFWIDDQGELNTVLEEQGLLGGITKRHFMELVKSKELKCHEKVIKPEELLKAKEVFMTNSVVGIKPVLEIDSTSIGVGEVGDVTAMLMDLWRHYLDECLDRMVD